jgi:bifunctional DNase/RNase
MEFDGVRIEVPANAPLIMLRERQQPGRLLPIYIGGPEAQAIAYAHEGRTPPRPFTHDLMCTVIERLDAALTRVVITELRDTTFYAELVLRRGTESLVVSSRPSDAVALAVRVGAPIFCSEELLDEAGQDAPVDEAEGVEIEGEAEELVDEFREFLDHISPDDFAG